MQIFFQHYYLLGCHLLAQQINSIDYDSSQNTFKDHKSNCAIEYAIKTKKNIQTS